MSGVWVWVALAVACLPSLFDHIQRMWQLEQYHYLPALGLALGLLIVQRWDRHSNPPRGLEAWSFLGLGAALSVLGFLASSSWLGALGFVCFLGGWLKSQTTNSGESLFHLWPPAVMLIPLPLGFDTSLTHWMQLWSSKISSYALDFLEIPHTLFGNVLRLPSGTLFVEEACSGVQSLFTVLFVGVLLIAIFRRSLWLIPAYVVAALFWAGAMNVARIVVIAYAQSMFDFDLAHGWQHAVLGYVCLVGACLLLLSTDRLLRVLAFPIESNSATGVEQNPIVYSWNRSIAQSDSRIVEMRTSRLFSSPWITGGLIGFSALVFICQVIRFAPNATANSDTIIGVHDRVVAVPESLSVLVPGFVQIAHETMEGRIDQPMGEHADVWKGEYKGMPVTIALSQPYPEWHDLCVCYTGAGLNLNDRKVVPTDEDWNYVAARFIADEGTVSYLWFSAFDATKRPANAPDTGVFTRWISRLNAGDSLLRQSAAPSKLVIVQLKVDLDGFLPQDSVEMLAELHLLARKVLGPEGNQQ